MADNTVPIVIGSALSGVVVTLLLSKFIFYPRDVPQTYTGGPRVKPFGDYGSIVTWFKVLMYFLPYALFLFGVIYD